MSVTRTKLKLGKGSAFVKSRLRPLPQYEDIWEADIQPVVDEQDEVEFWMGMVIEQEPSADEDLEELLSGRSFRLERIVSTGQVTPEGQWYDQETDEWVLLLFGAARLRFEDKAALLEMQAGDYVNIPAHRRHRVEWTDPDQQTVWLALHYRPEL